MDKLTMSQAIAAHQRGLSLPQAFYVDPEIFVLDMRAIIQREWLLIDHESRLAEPGDYFLFDIGSESIILVRDSQGEIRAFFNVCRHRGSRVCRDASGHVNTLVCPYHGWSYHLDGSLKRARNMPADFDPQAHGLYPCHVRVHHGLVFVNLSEAAPPSFEAMSNDLEPFMAMHGLSGAKVAAREHYPTHANWKLVVENFFECYHCLPAHPEFCSVFSRGYIEAYGAGAESGSPEAEQAFAAEYDAWQTRAREMGHATGLFVDAADSDHLRGAARIPIGPGKLTQTRDGQPAAPLMGTFTNFDGGETSCTFNPVSTLLMSNDHAVLFRFTPIEPQLTDVEIVWMVAGDAVEGVDYQRDNLIWLWDVTTRQDALITEGNSRGIESSRYQPGPYSEQETALVKFDDWYLGRLKAELEAC